MPEKMVSPELFRPSLEFPEVPYDHLLRQAAERYPDRLAIVYRNISLTYREVISMVNSIANGLHDLGLRKGDRLCIYTTNRPEYPITFLAAASLGIVISPMPPAYQESEIRYQLEHAEVKAILVERGLAANIVKAQEYCSSLRHILITGEQASEELPNAIPFAHLLRHSSTRQEHFVEISPQDLLAIVYSSGTTGLPQGAMLTHRNLVSNNLQFIAAVGIHSDDVALIFLPFSHIYGTMLTGSFLACGGTQVLMERFELQQSLQLSAEYGVTYYFVVPSIVRALANAPIDLSRLNSVKYIFSGAAPLALEPARELQKKTGIQVIQGYGLTEASPVTHCQPRQKTVQRLASIGMPVHNCQQKIVDLATGERELPVGEIGELLVSGPQVMQGYWKAPKATERVIHNGWLYTGDIGYIDSDGYTYIVDRKKDTFVCKGSEIAPAEIEALLLEHPAIIDAAIIGVPGDETSELIKGFVVVRKEMQVTIEEILTFVNQKLKGPKCIYSLEFLDSIPKTASGKILRRILREREKNSRRLRG